MYRFYRQYFRILLDSFTTMIGGDNLRDYLVKFQPFCSLLQPLFKKKDFNCRYWASNKIFFLQTRKELKILLLFLKFCFSFTKALLALEKSQVKDKFVKNLPRTAMVDFWLDSLMLVELEKHLADAIDLGKVVQKWSTLSKKQKQT